MERHDVQERRCSTTKNVDGGWAWVVLLAAFMNLLIVPGFSFITGMFQTEFLDEFGESVAKTSWVTSLCTSLLQLGGPLSGLLAHATSCRFSIFVGGILMGTGLALSFFATSLNYMMITFGIISGVGSGLIYSPSVVIVNLYFDRKRTLATGIALSASGVGIFVFPVLCQYILETYGGWRPAMLVFSGIMLQVCAFSAVMFPDHEVTRCRCTNPHSVDKTDKVHEGHLKNLDILKQPTFLIFCMEMFLLNCGIGIFMIHYPSYMLSSGIASDSIPFILSTNGISLSIARILLGAMAGSENIDTLSVYIGLRLVSIFVFGLIPFYATTYASHFVVMFLEGAHVAGGYSLIAPLTVRYFGQEKLPFAFGTEMICAGAGILVAPPIAGWLTDITGVYDYGFYIAGFSLLLSAICLMGIPILSPKIKNIGEYELTNTEIDVEKTMM